MKYISIPPKELMTTKESTAWCNSIYNGAIKDIRSQTLNLNISAEPEDPKDGSSVMWMANNGDIKVKINLNGAIVTRTVATY